MDEELPRPMMALLLGVPCAEPEPALGRSQHHVQRHTPKLCCGTREKGVEGRRREYNKKNEQQNMYNSHLNLSVALLVEVCSDITGLIILCSGPI